MAKTAHRLSICACIGIGVLWHQLPNGLRSSITGDRAPQEEGFLHAHAQRCGLVVFIAEAPR
jgi:hypothetical protein